MAERKGPEGEQAGHDPVESGRHEDRSTGADERDRTPAAAPADEGTELIENHRDSDSAESETTEPYVAPAEPGGADVLAFPSRPGDETDELVDFDDFDEEPIDLSALQADDALLDALGGTNPDIAVSAHDARPSLEALLVAWRQDIDAAPIGDLVDTETATAAIAAGNRPHRRLKRRHLVPVATAAAVLMITFTGVGVAARDAQPGDMLWGVAQVLYTDHTRSIQAASSARENLNTAESAIEHGNRNAAEAALRSAQEQMRGVKDEYGEYGLSGLRAAHASLTARMDQGNDPQPPEHPPPPTPTMSPSPSQPPHQPYPPTDSTAPPTSSDPTESSTTPSETSGSSENPSSGWGSGLFPQNSRTTP